MITALGRGARRFVGSSSKRTFILYPLLVVGWEVLMPGREWYADLRFVPVMVWGYAQYRVCGRYRLGRGGGGPGLDRPPERLVTSGPYAYTRNPMYLGHLIFLAGLAMTLRSALGGLLTGAVAIWFHTRVLRDEQRLLVQFGEPYREYLIRVKRWIPGLL